MSVIFCWFSCLEKGGKLVFREYLTYITYLVIVANQNLDEWGLVPVTGGSGSGGGKGGCSFAGSSS